VAEKKIKFEKNWFEKVNAETKRERTLLAIEQVKVTKAEDLPELLSCKEAAPILKTGHKTIADWMAKGHLRSIKIRGRRFTTPQWIADFLKQEIVKNG
jgi:excisionase family DNA binding protein